MTLSEDMTQRLGRAEPFVVPEQPALPYGRDAYLALLALARLQREPVDAVAVRSIIEAQPEGTRPRALIATLATALGLSRPLWSHRPDPARMPQIVVGTDGGWGVVQGRDASGGWSVARPVSGMPRLSERMETDFPAGAQFLRLRLRAQAEITKSPMFRLVSREILGNHAALFNVAAASIGIYVLALATSLFSMQVYDRVIPTSAYATLLTLSIGVAMAIALENFGKFTRSTTLDRLSDAVDQRLARSVYGRFLNIRLDQLPTNVGSAAQRMRSYETIRSFIVNAASQVLIDLPICGLFLIVLFLISGWLTLIPAAFFVISIMVGLAFRKRLERSAENLAPTTQHKTSLLIESVKGAETIKSSQAGWRMLSKWLEVTDDARHHELFMRSVSSRQQIFVGALQQFCYISVVAAGALLVGKGDMTFGGLIACSILSGRILQPTAQIPSTIMQWAQAKAATEDLDRLWALGQDQDEGHDAVLLNRIAGDYRLAEVAVRHDDIPVLEIKNLHVAAGEKVALIGAIGSGKTSLLRLLTGMYKPTQGQITLDGVDIGRIAKTSLGQTIGYIPQDGHLFSGTLRENLILGLPDPGDDRILDAARRSGLFEAVIKNDPNGLDRCIHEGGAGLSGGQRQLVHVTRVMLRAPKIWLLDEPTASMDPATEHLALMGIQAALVAEPQSTLCLVTHKAQLLALVDRVIVMGRGRIMMDGPRDEIIKRLQTK